MDIEKAKVRERIELSLDGRQIASVVVGALVLLGVVFVLGLNLGRQLAAKQLDATRGDALAALDRPPSAPGAPISDDALTYHDRLTKDRPALADEPPPRAAPPPAPAAVAAPAPGPAAVTAPPPTPAPAAHPAAPAAPAATGGYALQLMSTTSRAEADKLVSKLQEFEPRVESAEVAGKGRVYRVRAGPFQTRAEAEQQLKTIAARSGTKGMVVTLRAK